jgi:putative oxidoreductase
MVSLPAPRRLSAPWLRLLFGTASAGLAMDVALLAVRIGLAWIFIYYGGAKLFGWFPGAGPHGIHQTSIYMAQAAHLKPGGLFAVLGGVVEFGGGIAVAVGLFTRLAGLALFGDMVMAMITVTWSTGLNPINTPPGYQLNLAVAVLALMAALGGAGRFSVDSLIARAGRGGAAIESPAG